MMETCTQSEFEALVENAKVLADGLRGPRVYLRPDQKVVKVFYSKKRLTSDRLVPYALRFKRCAERLNSLGFRSVSVEKVVRCRDLRLHFVIYPLLAGLSVRELGEHSGAQSDRLTHLGKYVADLHKKGVYYKALHLGNIIVQADGSFALIDIHSTKFYKTPVSVNRRVKNLLNMFRYEEDCKLIENLGFSRYFGEYIQASGLNVIQQSALIGKLSASIPLPELKTALDNLN